MKYLLLLDLSKTLLYKSEFPLQGVEEVEVRKRVLNRYIYPRSGLLEFFDLIRGTNTYLVCAYTSMKMHNARNIIKAIQPKGKQWFDRTLAAGLCKKDAEAEASYKTIKDLRRVWKQRGLGKFGPRKTIIVENERRKVRECLENAIMVTEYTANDIKKEDRVLKELGEFLVRLADVRPFDVRRYLEKCLKCAKGLSSACTRDEELLRLIDDKKNSDIDYLLGVDFTFVNLKRHKLSFANFQSNISIRLPIQSLPSDVYIDRELTGDSLKQLGLFTTDMEVTALSLSDAEEVGRNQSARKGFKFDHISQGNLNFYNYKTKQIIRIGMKDLTEDCSLQACMGVRDLRSFPHEFSERNPKSNSNAD